VFRHVIPSKLELMAPLQLHHHMLKLLFFGMRGKEKE